MMIFAMHSSHHASWLRVLSALLIMISASLTTPAHAVDISKDAATWFSEAPLDSGQSDVCLCDALLICTTAALGPLLTSDIPYFCPRNSFWCFAGVDPWGWVLGVPLPPPKTA